MANYLTPAQAILGAKSEERKEFESPEDELRRDRRALIKIGAGAAVLGGAGAAILQKGRGATVPAVAVKVPKGVRKPAVKAARKKAKAFSFEDKRGKLEKTRDAAIIAGTGATGAGALVVANQAKKLRKQAGDALGYAGSSVARAAKEVKREVTPERVAREGLRMVKKKAKQKAVEYFPTFTRAAGALKKTVFSTPARELGVIDFKVREQLRNSESDVYANPLRVAAGVEKAYRPGPGKTRIAEDLPIGNAQVIRAAVRKADDLNKWGTRGGRLAKDAADVVRGKPRERDGSGRKKKREWEKSWAQNAAKKAVITAGVLGYATGLKKSPRLRAAHNKATAAVKSTVNRYIPDAFPDRTFETPARQLGVIQFARKKDEKVSPGAAAIAGSAGGATAGALLGQDLAKSSKESRNYDEVRRKHHIARSAAELNKATGEKWKGGKAKDRPAFGKGKLTNGEKMARAEHEAHARYRGRSRGNMVKGGLAGAAVVGGLHYAGARVANRDRRKGFSTPARELGVIHFDENAADAGWDIRDPRGKSARVFAPGSRRRNRREKKWHEQVGNERKLRTAATVAAAVGGAAAGVVIGRRLPKKVVKPKAEPKVLPFKKQA